MPKVIWLIMIFMITACASPGPAVRKDREQHPRDYSVYNPVVPVMPEIIADNHMPWTAVSQTQRRKVFFNDRQTMVLNEWTKEDKGKDVSLQYHPNDVSGYVLDGNLMVTIDKQTQSMGPGGVFVIPSNVHYSLLPLSAKVRFLEIFTPTRDDLRKTPPPVRFDENDIKSLVHQWFSLMDKMAEADKLLPFLSAKNLTVRFPGVLFKSREDFRTWYAAELKKLKSSTYKVQQMQVKIDHQNNYIVHMTVSRQATTLLDEDRSYRSQQAWIFMDQGGDYPVVTYMDVEENRD